MDGQCVCVSGVSSVECQFRVVMSREEVHRSNSGRTDSVVTFFERDRRTEAMTGYPRVWVWNVRSSSSRVWALIFEGGAVFGCVTISLEYDWLDYVTAATNTLSSECTMYIVSVAFSLP
jgi:hypothetical protein